MTKNATKEGQLKPGHSKKAACLSVSSKKKNSKIRHLLLKSLKYEIFAENMEARHIFIWCLHVYYLKNSLC